MAIGPRKIIRENQGKVLRFQKECELILDEGSRFWYQGQDITDILENVSAILNNGDTSQSQIAQMSMLIDELESQASGFITGIDDLNNLIDAIQQELEAIPPSVSHLSSNINTVSQQFNTIETEMQQVAQNITSINEQIDQLMNDSGDAALQTSLNQIKTDLLTLQTNAQSQLDSINQLNTEYASLKDGYENDKETWALEADLNILNNQQSGFSASISNLMNNIDTQESALNTLSNQLNHLSSSVLALPADDISWKTRLAAVENGTTSALNSISSVQTTITGLQNAVSAEQTSITNIQSNLGTVQNNITAMQSSVTTNTNAISTLNATATTNQTNISSLQTSITSNANAITALQSSVNTNQSSISSLQSSSATIQNNVTAVQAAIASLQTSMSAAQSTISSLQTSVTSFQALLQTAPGVIQASKIVQVDSNKDIASFRNLSAQKLISGDSATQGVIELFAGTATKATLKSDALSANYSYNFPNIGSNTDIVVKEGNQTINGVKNFANFIQIDNIAMSAIKYIDVTVTAALLASNASIVVIPGVAGDQYRIRDIKLVGGGTSFNALGNRNLILTDNATTYTTVSSADLKALPATTFGWGALATILGNILLPQVSAAHTLTASNAALVFKYSGGTTDYTSGSVIFSLCLEKIV